MRRHYGKRSRLRRQEKDTSPTTLRSPSSSRGSRRASRGRCSDARGCRDGYPRRGAAIGQDARLDFDVNRHTVRARRDGDLGAQTVERAACALRGFASGHSNGAKTHVRVSCDRARQTVHRFSWTFGLHQENDVGRSEIGAFVPIAAGRSFRDDIRFFEQLTPARVRRSQEAKSPRVKKRWKTGPGEPRASA